MKSVLRVICFCVLQISVSHSGPPKFEARPNLSDSYVPALMQIIAHDTELMKYEIKPQAQVTTTTTSRPPTTTTRPSTPAHFPGILQPVPPPKPSQVVPQVFPQNTKVTIPPFLQTTSGLPYSYYPVVPGIVGFIPLNGLLVNRGFDAPLETNGFGNSFGQNGQFIGQNAQYFGQSGPYFGQAQAGQYFAKNGEFITPNAPYFGQNGHYFGHMARSLATDKHEPKQINTRSLRKSEQEQISQLAKNLKLTEEEQISQNVDTYLGKGFSDVYKLANSVENDYDEEAKFLQFSKNFDDVDFGLELLKQLRQKRIPPTKAYVTLLNLYDELNKELKRLGFSKFTGYNQAVLKDLVESSTQTSAYQLRFILKKTVDNQDLKNPTIVTKLKNLLKDFDDENGYIYRALSDIPPLAFSD